MRGSRLIYFCGGSLALLGLVAIAGWLGHVPALVQVVPGFHGMPYATATGFVLAGPALIAAETAACWVAPGAGRWLCRMPAALLLLLALVALVDWQFGPLPGLRPDLAAMRAWFDDANPFAGRMRPLAALAFLAMGTALLLPFDRRGSVLAAQGAALLVLFVGFLGVVGQLAGFDKFFSWYLGPVFSASVGFLICALGLFALQHKHAAAQGSWGGRCGERIGLVAGGIVALTGLAGIYGGFAVLYPQAVGALEGKLALSLNHRSRTLSEAITQGWLDSRSFANQPLRLAAMARLNTEPADAARQAQLQAVADRHAGFGFSAVVFRDAAGREVARAGRFVADPELTVTLRTPTPSLLMWRGGYVLRTRVPMIDRDTIVGSLEAEQILRPPENLHDTSHFGSSLDFAICATAGDKLDCFPFRSTGGKVLRDLPTRWQGQPIPMTHALAGESGIVHSLDYRGVRVIAAHTPVGDLGLGAVLKVDADELYQPIAQRLGPLVLMLAAVWMAAMVLLRLQLLPLVRRLTGEIEERKRVEAQLEESRAELDEITTNLGEGAYVLDPNGIVTFANPEAERLLGWTAAELVGRNGHDMIHFRRPDGSAFPEDQCPIHAAIATGKTYRGLHDWFVHKDGSLLPVSVIASPIVRNGELKGSVLTYTDISARLTAEAALRQSEARFRSTLENAPIGMGVVGPDGRFLQTNQALCRLLGYTREELGRLDLNAISHADDRAPTEELRRQVLAGGPDHYTVEKRYLRKDGQAIWVQVTVSTIRDDAGRPQYMIGQVEDISERRRRDELLRESEERFRLISTVATDGIVTIDAEGQIAYWNPAAERIFGYRAGEAAGRNLHELLAPSRFLADHHKGYQRFLASGQGPLVGKTFETVAVRRSGEEFPVEVSISALRIKDQWQALGVIRDISERKKTEEQIRHLAYYDALTDLPNRRLFLDRLNQALVQARRYRRSVAVLYLDLDRFKAINDSLGHDVGDELLVAVAARLRDCVRGSDTVSRLGGDEFAMVLAEIARPEDAAVVADKIIERMEEPVPVQGRELRISTSIGIAVYPVDGTDDARELIKKADIALYEAKAAGRNRYLFAGAGTG